MDDFEEPIKAWQLDLWREMRDSAQDEDEKLARYWRRRRAWRALKTAWWEFLAALWGRRAA